MPRLVSVQAKKLHMGNFGALYMAIVLLSLHWSLVVYINASYIAEFVAEQTLNVLYMGGSAITLIAFLAIANILKRTGNYRLILELAMLETVALVGMALAGSPTLAVLAFLLHLIIVPLILFNLDVFMEELIGTQENSTGGRRGLYLSIMSLAGAIAPLAGGYLLGAGEPRYEWVYFAAAVLMLPFMAIIITFFRDFQDPEYQKLHPIPTLKAVWRFKDVRNVFGAHLLLQIFFAWSIIYIPSYLLSVGLHWEQIGVILFVGLMAYVFIEYPTGIIADAYIGEKEMMAIGFLVLVVSVAAIAYINTTALWPWMLVMFMTRVGASLTEATSESYFFKHMAAHDTNTIGLFRLTRPLSMIIGAPLGGLSLLFLPFNLIFIVLAVVLAAGFFFAMALHDTK